MKQQIKLLNLMLTIFVLFGVSFIPLWYWQSLSQAQTNFRVWRLPFERDYEIGSYVDHDGKTNDKFDKNGPFMFMNGDSYANRQPYFYDGHNGIDWSLRMGTTVYAVATGTVRFKALGSDTYGYRIIVEHEGGYSTSYSHLLPFTIEGAISLTVGQTVTMGQPIALSGNTKNLTDTWPEHLHFEVLHTTPRLEKTDPFGWRSQPGQDPLAYNGVDSQCLWNNEWCQETIVEDRDIPITGTTHYEETVGEPPMEEVWFDTGGNQNGARYLLSNSFYGYARWKPTLPMKGRYEIFAFIPPANATTQNAIYKINTVNGLVTATINQNANKNGWVQLTNTLTRSFVLKCNGDVALDNDTGESERTQIVFDTMKFRLIGESVPCAAKNYLPIIRRDPTSTPTDTPTATPTDTPSPTDTATNTPIPTNTPTRTPKPTKTPTRTPSPTPPLVPPTPGVTPIPTDTPVATNTPPPTKTSVPISTKTPTVTRSPTPTKTSTVTNTPKPTNTPLSPPPTITSTATRTPIPTRTSIPTIN